MSLYSYITYDKNSRLKGMIEASELMCAVTTLSDGKILREKILWLVKINLT